MLSKFDVEHIAKLARLDLTDKEKTKFAEDLSSIIGYIEKLSEVNIEKVEPMTGGINLESVVRKDEKGKGIADDEMKSNIIKAAPSREDSYFKVPSILE